MLDPVEIDRKVALAKQEIEFVPGALEPQGTALKIPEDKLVYGDGMENAL
jgi:hypothetical protein